MASLDEEIQEHSDQDFGDVDKQPEVDQEEMDEYQRRQEALENYRQRQFRQQQQEQEEDQRQSPQNQALDMAENLVKDKAKKIVKNYIWEFLLATWEVWVPALLIILAISFVIGIVIIIPPAVCNSSVFDGAGIGSAKAVLTASGVCKAFQTTPATPAQTVIVNPGTPRPPTGGMTDAEARKLLTQANICNYPLGWSRADCVNANEPQTSLNGIQQAVLNEIIRFRADCYIWASSNGGGFCEVVVTGGTETNAGHAQGPCGHLTGNKIDIRTTSTTSLIDRYITKSNNFTPMKNRSDGAAQYKNNSTSVIYARESNHWDIGGIGCT